MRFLPLVLRSLFRSRRRTLLTVLSLAVSVALVTLLQSLLGTMDSLTTSTASGTRLVVQDKASFTNVIPLAYANFLRQQPEVEQITAIQWFGGEYQDPRNFFANFAVDPETYLQVYREEANVASIPLPRIHEFLRDGNGCMVGRTLAERFGWKLGDVVPLRSSIFNLTLRLNIRIIFTGQRRSDETVLLFNIRQLQEAVPWMKGRVGAFAVRARNPFDIPRLCERIDRHFANSAQETLSITENAFNLNMMKMLGDYTTMVHSISLAVVLAILIVTANTMAGAIRERTAELSTLRALGFSSGRILSLLMAEGLLLSLLGCGLGLGLALGAASGAARVGGEILPWMADFIISGETLLLGLLLTLGLGLASTFVPAYRASRRPITEGLRAL